MCSEGARGGGHIGELCRFGGVGDDVDRRLLAELPVGAEQPCFCGLGVVDAFDRLNSRIDAGGVDGDLLRPGADKVGRDARPGAGSPRGEGDPAPLSPTLLSILPPSLHEIAAELHDRAALDLRP
jgi:hypothetical protein